MTPGKAVPYHWQDETTQAPDHFGACSYAVNGDAPLATLTLWPYRSLSRRGFVWFMGTTIVLISLPLSAFLGKMALWGILPFLLLTIGLMWYFLDLSYKDAHILEEVKIWSDIITVEHRSAKHAPKSWRANPYWVNVQIHPKGGPVEDYLTLKGEGREIEMGAFLSREERRRLHKDLGRLLANLPR